MDSPDFTPIPDDKPNAGCAKAIISYTEMVTHAFGHSISHINEGIIKALDANFDTGLMDADDDTAGGAIRDGISMFQGDLVNAFGSLNAALHLSYLESHADIFNMAMKHKEYRLAMDITERALTSTCNTCGLLYRVTELHQTYISALAEAGHGFKLGILDEDTEDVTLLDDDDSINHANILLVLNPLVGEFLTALKAAGWDAETWAKGQSASKMLALVPLPSGIDGFKASAILSGLQQELVKGCNKLMQVIDITEEQYDETLAYMKSKSRGGQMINSAKIIPTPKDAASKPKKDEGPGPAVLY